MKTLVVYYSFSGHCKKYAEELAAAQDLDLLELRDEKKMNMLRAFYPGCPNAMKRAPARLADFAYNWPDYDELVFVVPVWAGCPAPALNNCIAVLPQGKEVTLVLLSGSGSSAKSREGTIALVESRGCTVSEYRDVKAGGR